MATSMALETNHIAVSAMRLESLAKSDLEGLHLLLGVSKLIPDISCWKKPATLPGLSPLPNRLWVRLVMFFYMRFSMLNSLIDPLRGADGPIATRNCVAPKMPFGIYSILMSEE